MSNTVTQPTASSHATVDLRQFPWSRRLINDYTGDFLRVSSLFAGNSFSATDWQSTISRVLRHQRRPGGLADILLRQLERRDAPKAAREAAVQFEQGDAVAIVTGQQ